MDMKYIFFSFKGRLPRLYFWLYGVMVSIYIFVLSMVFSGMCSHSDGDVTWCAIVLFVMLASIWPTLSVVIKRLHDRAKSGWWALVYLFVPELIDAFVVFIADETQVLLWPISYGVRIWVIIDLGFLRGTNGPNRFGLDPLANNSQEANLT